MVSKDYEIVKLIDFGMSRNPENLDGGKTHNKRVALRWSAPEMFEGKGKSVKFSPKSVTSFKIISLQGIKIIS